MSQPDPTADQQAAAAVVRHHAALATTLEQHVTALLDAAATGDAHLTQTGRAALTTWLHDELLPHARAEEATLYPAAAARPGGDLLITGMVADHHTIAELVTLLESAATPVAAAAAARALQAVFTSHLAKENDLVIPLLAGADDGSLAALLDGMHDLIGAEPATEDGCGCGGACGDGATADRAAGDIGPLRSVSHV